MSDASRRVAFVPARYGPEIVGGAEIVLAHMARGLLERGWEAEILTTCALNHHTWENELPAGVGDDNGLLVRRFPVDNRVSPTRGELEARVMAGHRLTYAEQSEWMNGGMRSPELYHYILDHAQDYRAMVFAPYPFWVTFACSQIDPSRSVLMSCLHDEPYVYLDLFTPMLSGVAGLLMLSEPEHDLGHKVNASLAPHRVTGCGVEIPASYQPQEFTARYGITRPYLFYAGRREGAKGWEDLLDAFDDAVRRRPDLPFALVTCGGGEVNPPEGIADRVIDVGFLSESERDSAYAGAAAYVQPSRYESFSRTIMEAWLAGVPVIANGGSSVVAWHCERSGAGLLYNDPLEFEQCLAALADAPEAMRELAAKGRAYVLEHYQWDTVLDAVEECLNEWTSAQEEL